MAVTGHAGPLVIYGSVLQGAPSPIALGTSLLDSRIGYSPGQDVTTQIFGWNATTDIVTVDAVPAALGAAVIAASAVPVGGTPVVLVSATGGGITAGSSVKNAATGQFVNGLLAIGGAAGTVAFAQDGTVVLYDPRTAIARNVTVTSAGNDSAATFLVSGYDIYGYPMTERITGINVGVGAGRKAFKYIASVTPAGTLSGAAVTVGVGDVFGLPLRADFFPYLSITNANTVITTSTGFTAADTTSPATSTTGDPRGTYALQTASNGTNRLFIAITPAVYNLTSTAGLVGVTPA